MNNINPIYKMDEFDFAKINVSELRVEGMQPMAFMNYRNSSLNALTKIFVQSGSIKITSRGIPRLSKEGEKNAYFVHDAHREFIMIALDPSQEACCELRRHLEKADAWAGSEEFRRKLFGSRRWEKYEYQPTVKIPRQYEDNDEAVRCNPPIPYVKMKFDMIVRKNKRINKTLIRKLAGSQVTNIKAETITDIASTIKFGSEIKFIFSYNKIWANKMAMGTNKICYSIGFKILAIDVGRGYELNSVEYLPLNDLETIRQTYKKYMSEQKENIKKKLAIEI